MVNHFIKPSELKPDIYTSPHNLIIIALFQIYCDGV